MFRVTQKLYTEDRLRKQQISELTVQTQNIFPYYKSEPTHIRLINLEMKKKRREPNSYR